MPAPISGTSTFARAVSEGSSRWRWKTKPTTSRRALAGRGSVHIGRPSISTLPESGCSRPPIIASSVLLPEPERPVMAIASPGDISSETSCSEAMRPKLLLTPSTATAAPLGALTR